jgi:hypothetical protein
LSPEPTTVGEVVTVQNAITVSSVVSHIKNNRIEYIGLIILSHLLGVSDYVLSNASGVCLP